MPDPLAELSSVSSALDEITDRVTRLAGELAAQRREDAASQLVEVERALIGAKRRLGKLLDTR
ncbi:MAG: hypothetical protein ACLGHT_08660 [Acidimicrobiia bacterium]